MTLINDGVFLIQLRNYCLSSCLLEINSYKSTAPAMLFMLYDTPTTAPCELLLCIQYCVLYPVGCDLIFLLRLTSKHPCAHYLSFNLTSTFSYFFGQARLEVKRGKKYFFSVSCVMLYYLLLLRTPICSLSDPSQKVLFGRPFAKFWSLNPVEMDTFLA